VTETNNPPPNPKRKKLSCKNRFPCTSASGIRFGSASESAACSYGAMPDLGLFLWMASITLAFLATAPAKVSKLEKQPVVITLFDKA